MMRFSVFVLGMLVWNLGAWGQSACELPLHVARENMMHHIGYLSSDELEGRYPGTEGAEKARQYIAQVLRENGALPAVSDDGSQWFTVARLASFPPDRNSAVPPKTGVALKNTFPHPHTSNGAASGKIKRVGYGMDASDLGRNDFRNKRIAGKIALIQAGTPDGKGAGAMVVYVFAIWAMLIGLAAYLAPGLARPESDAETRIDPVLPKPEGEDAV